MEKENHCDVLLKKQQHEIVQFSMCSIFFFISIQFKWMWYHNNSIFNAKMKWLYYLSLIGFWAFIMSSEAYLGFDIGSISLDLNDLWEK